VKNLNSPEYPSRPAAYASFEHDERRQMHFDFEDAVEIGPAFRITWPEVDALFGSDFPVTHLVFSPGIMRAVSLQPGGFASVCGSANSGIPRDSVQYHGKALSNGWRRLAVPLGSEEFDQHGAFFFFAVRPGFRDTQSPRGFVR
jgi:hypothetical protein